MESTPKKSLLMSDFLSDNGKSQRLLDEINQLRQINADQKKEKSKLNVEIQALQDNIECAENANKIAASSALTVAQKLVKLFGKKLSDEDLVKNIQELQDRADKAHQELILLKANIAAQEMIAPEREETNATMSKNIAEQSRKVEKDIKKIDFLINEKKKDISSLLKKREKEANNYQNYVSTLVKTIGSEHIEPYEVCNKIKKNSSKIAQKSYRLLRNIDPNIASSLTLPEVIDTIRQEITSIKIENKSSFNIEELKTKKNGLMANRKALNKNISELTCYEHKLKLHLSNIECNQIEIPVQNACAQENELEKAAQAKRLNTLRKGLQKAYIESGLNWIPPRSHADVCLAYVQLAESLRREAASAPIDNRRPVSTKSIERKIGCLQESNLYLSEILKYRL